MTVNISKIRVMRKNATSGATKKIPLTIASMLDDLQEGQRAARADIVAAHANLARAVEHLESADEMLVKTAEMLGLPVEG